MGLLLRWRDRVAEYRDLLTRALRTTGPVLAVVDDDKGHAATRRRLVDALNELEWIDARLSELADQRAELRMQRIDALALRAS